MKKPRLLDLFCCAGGAGKGYFDAGFDVVGIDINPQPRYPFEFHQSDALEYLKNHWMDFDVIHASPPCQFYSQIQHIVKSKHKWPELIEPTRAALIETNKPFVIENVQGAPLRIDLFLCGSFFNIGMIRHRIFESNVCLEKIDKPCNHKNMYDPWHYGTNQRVEMSKGMGINWDMKREEVREAIPPAFTEYIGLQIINSL